MKETVMKPWTPVRVRDEGEKISVSVWGRENCSGKLSFLESMHSQGKEILYAPIRIVGKEDGVDFCFTNYQNLLMAKNSDAECGVVSISESEQFITNLSMKTEFDGFIDTTFTIMPKGRSVNQIFGLESLKPYEYRLEKLWIEIPIRKECAKYYQFFPRENNTSPLTASDAIRSRMSFPFKEQILIANDDVGFFICFETIEGFEPYGKETAFEIIPEDESVVLRIRLFDEEPLEWRTIDYSDTKERMSLAPRSFHFGIMTTPVKPLDRNMTSEKAVHIDCFKKLSGDYEDFLSEKFEGTDEVTFDRLKRLGVNTLYLHTKWNDIQNSPILTAKTEARLTFIIDECHKRGIKVIPYFGYGISSLAPYYREMLPRVEARMIKCGRWYRQPPQRATKVCQKSSWSEFFTDGIEKLIDEYGFDGLYLDGTAYTWPCINTSHGCGYYAPNGELIATYPVFGTRKTLKRLYRIVCEERGGIINCHSGSAFNMPALSFVSSMWDGEAFQSELLHGRIDRLPDEYFKCLYSGKNLGLKIYMLCYLNPPVWDLDMALSVALPYGILPKVNDVGEPLEKISEIWRIFDEFGVNNSSFIPYYEECDKEVAVSDPRVKLSLYKNGEKLLAIAAVTDKNLDVTFNVECHGKTLRDARSGRILSENGTAELSLSGFDFRLIEIY